MNLKRIQAHSDHLSTYLEGLEELLFDPVARRDISAVSSLLAEDFREFGSSGRIYTKLDILAELSTEQPVVISLTDFLCELVVPNVALVTYKSFSSLENRMPTQALRSSLWVQRHVQPISAQISGHITGHITGQGSQKELRWQMLFHQGTRF